MEASIRLYLDENLSPKIARQLKLRGVDALSVQELKLMCDSDVDHLARATDMQRVLVTCDVDFLRLASEGLSHTGIIFGIQGDHSIGDWVNNLELIAFVYSAEEFVNHVEYL